MGEKIYGRTREEAYEVRQKLYELEEILPIAFCRISKSTIVQYQADLCYRKIFFGNQYSKLLSNP